MGRKLETRIVGHEYAGIPTAVFILFLSIFTFAYSPTHDSLYFFYQRTVYLDNPLMDGAWFSNPSSIADVAEPTAFTVNTTPLGDRYTIASVRFFFPTAAHFTAGLGITGASDDIPDASFQATEGGTTYQGHFLFSRPSFETGIAVKVPYIGSLGLLQSFGMEVVPGDIGSGDRFFIWGNGFGWLSPELLSIISFTLSTFSVGPFPFSTKWEHCAKIGTIVQYNEDLLRAAIEYSFSLNDRFILLRKKYEMHGYEVMKILISARIYNILGILAGYSSDTPLRSDNGPTVHLGLEMRKSHYYPFFGGYEVGVSTTNFPAVIHRVWFGYRFVKKKHEDRR